MTIEIKKIPFSSIEEAGISLKDKISTYSLRKHAEEKGADVAVNGAMFSNGSPLDDPFYYWNIVDMVIDGVLNRGGNYTDKGIAFGKPFAGISAYKSTTSNSIGKPVDFVGGAPTLIVDGVINMDMKGLSSSFATAYTKRTAIGIDASNLYIATTRGTSHTLQQVAQALLAKGCKNAINFDGGGSVAYYEKKSDGTLDYYTQNRNITSAFYVKLKKTVTTTPTNTTEKKVFLGVGHGGGDPGASFNGINEKDVNLQIAKSCNDELVRHGVKTLLSRYKDEYDPLANEITECNAFNPDIAIDFHNNAGKGDGAEFFYSTKDTNSKKLAMLLEKYVLLLGQNSRGIKTKLNSYGADYFGFNRQVKAPNVITESAFIDNPLDFSILDSIEEQKRFGIAYAKAILEYFNIPWKEDFIDNPNGYIVESQMIQTKIKAEELKTNINKLGYSATVKEV